LRAVWPCCRNRVNGGEAASLCRQAAAIARSSCNLKRAASLAQIHRNMTGPKVSEPAALPDSYQALLSELKQSVAEARLRAALAVNRELVILYWRIGRDILLR
jgi:hypothetical protein